MSYFRDMPHKRVEFRLRPTFDLRAPRDAFRFMRAAEQRKSLAARTPTLGRGLPPSDPSALNDPQFLAPYADIDEGREPAYESAESLHGVGATFR